NANWEYFKNKAKEQLSSEVGQSIYAQRKIDVEPIFADLKVHLSFNRLSVRGLENAKIEIGLALMSNNLAELARLLSYPAEYQKNTIGIPYFMEISIVFF
ncbi:IS5/IS1182 family transposase, partial [Companilactobacillus suantsaicola]